MQMIFQGIMATGTPRFEEDREMSRALHEKPELTNARADFYGRMAEQSMTPLWEVLHTLLSED